MNNAKGYVRGFDVRTGKRLWIFHTVPEAGRVRLRHLATTDRRRRNGNTGAWAQFSADLELGLVYVPVEMPTGDYYGGNRPGNTLFDESLVALDIKTGKRKWHYQIDASRRLGLRPAVRADPVRHDDRTAGAIKALAQPTKQAFLFVLNRETGEPIWPIEERPVPQSTVPGEKTSPTQPFPTKPAPFDRQGVSVDDLIDFTPALRAEALEVDQAVQDRSALHAAGAEQRRTARSRRCSFRPTSAARTGRAASFDPETNRLYIHSHTAAYFAAGIVPGQSRRRPTSGYVRARRARAGPVARGAAARPRIPVRRRRRGAAGRAGAAAWRRPRRHDGAGPAAHQAAVRSDHRLRHEHRRHALAEDAQLDARRHQEQSGAARARTCRGSASPAARSSACSTTKTLLIAGEGGVHTQRGRASASRCCAPTTRRPAPTSARSTCRTSRPARR